MKLSAQQLDQVKKRLESSGLWTDPPCPVCRHNDWHVSDRTFQLLDFPAERPPIAEASLPVLPITCSHCGNTFFLNALVLGLLPSETPDTVKRPKS